MRSLGGAASTQGIAGAARDRGVHFLADTTQARLQPISATRNVTPVVPTQPRLSAHTECTTPKPSRPQGTPPRGQVLRSTSTAVHSSALHTGHAGKRLTRRRPSASAANHAAWTRVSANQAPGPMDAQSHQRTAPMKVSPKSAPVSSETRRDPCLAPRTRRPTPTGER